MKRALHLLSPPSIQRWMLSCQVDRIIYFIRHKMQLHCWLHAWTSRCLIRKQMSMQGWKINGVIHRKTRSDSLRCGTALVTSCVSVIVGTGTLQVPSQHIQLQPVRWVTWQIKVAAGVPRKGCESLLAGFFITRVLLNPEPRSGTGVWHVLGNAFVGKPRETPGISSSICVTGDLCVLRIQSRQRSRALTVLWGDRLSSGDRAFLSRLASSANANLITLCWGQHGQQRDLNQTTRAQTCSRSPCELVILGLSNFSVFLDL